MMFFYYHFQVSWVLNYRFFTQNKKNKSSFWVKSLLFEAFFEIFMWVESHDFENAKHIWLYALILLLCYKSHWNGRRRLISAAGVLIFVVILALLSKHPRKIDWRQVSTGFLKGTREITRLGDKNWKSSTWKQNKTFCHFL